MFQSHLLFIVSLSLCLSCDVSCRSCQDTNCATCYSDAHLVSKACICDNAYFPNPDASSCQPCDLTCLTCLSISVCTSCGINRYMRGTSCLCVDGYYDNIWVCMMCDSTCLTCVGPGSCTSCFANASPADGVCQCNSGFMESPNAANCLAACGTNSSQDSNGKCHCTAGTYLSSQNQCLACPTACLSCSSDTVCLSCISGASIVGGLCFCNLGSFVGTASCSACHPTCQSCVDASESGCIGCKPSADLSSLRKCVCSEGSYPSPDSSNCVLCPDSCLSCVGAQCSRCSSGYWLTQGKCQACASQCLKCDSAGVCDTCETGTFLTLAKECVECSNCGQPLTAAITSPYSKQYRVEFSRYVTKAFEGADFALSTDPPSQMQWQVSSTIEVLIAVDGGPWASSTVITVKFTRPELVHDLFGNYLNTTEVKVPPPVGLVREEQTLPTPTNTTTESVSSSKSTNDTVESVVSMGSSIIAGSVLSVGAVGTASLAIGLINQMEYFSYLSATGVQFPAGMQQFFGSMNQRSSLPNFFSKGGVSRGRRLTLDAGEPDFFDDAGRFVSVLLILVGVHCAVSLLATLCTQQKLLKAVKTKLEWSVYLYFWCFSYLDLSILAFRQLKEGSLSREDWRRLLATVLSVVLAVCLAVTPALLFILIRKHRDELFTADQTVQKTAWAPVTSHIRLDLPFAHYYLPVTYSQRFLYSAFLVLLAEHRYLQSVFLLFPPVLVTLFVLTARPLQFKVMRVMLVLAEVETLCVYVCVCVLTFGYKDTHEVIAWLIASLTVKSLVCLLGITVVGVYVRLKTACESRKSAPVQPITGLPVVRDTVLTETVDDSMVQAMKPRFFERAMWRDNDTKSSHYLNIHSPTSTQSGGYPNSRHRR